MATISKREFILGVLAEAAGVDVTPDTLIASLGLDLIDEAEIILDIEDEFDIELGDDALRKFETVWAFIGHCEERTG